MPPFTVELDKAWREKLRNKLEQCRSISDDERQFMLPLFSTNDRFVACRERVYENNTHRDEDDFVHGLANDAFSLLRQGRTDDLDIPMGTVVYDLLVTTTRAVYREASGRPSEERIPGFDINRVT